MASCYKNIENSFGGKRLGAFRLTRKPRSRFTLGVTISALI